MHLCTCDIWHVTPDTWHLTCDTWHMTPNDSSQNTTHDTTTWYWQSQEILSCPVPFGVFHLYGQTATKSEKSSGLSSIHSNIWLASLLYTATYLSSIRSNILFASLLYRVTFDWPLFYTHYHLTCLSSIHSNIWLAYLISAVTSDLPLFYTH